MPFTVPSEVGNHRTLNSYYIKGIQNKQNLKFKLSCAMLYYL